MSKMKDLASSMKLNPRPNLVPLEAQAVAFIGSQTSNSSEVQPPKTGRPPKAMAKYKEWTKTTLYFEPAKLKALRHLSIERNEDVSDLVNEALAAYLKQ